MDVPEEDDHIQHIAVGTDAVWVSAASGKVINKIDKTTAISDLCMLLRFVFYTAINFTTGLVQKRNQSQSGVNGHKLCDW